MSEKPEDVLNPFIVRPDDTDVTDFYGVQIPGSTENSPVVLRKLPAQKSLRDLSPQLMFKKFSNYKDAAKYSKFELALPVDETIKKVSEPKSVFSNPSYDDQELFCKALRCGDCATVRRMLWKNPRLLITTSSDNPQIFRGTWRQTALHLALMGERDDLKYPMFCTVMEIIEDPAFVDSTRLTPYEDVAGRRHMIISSILNNRNKRNESILDCAVMQGMVDIVDFLVVHPLCNLSVSDRTSDQWMKLAVSKLEKDDTKRKKLAQHVVEMVTDRWYVPLFASSHLFSRCTLGSPLCVGRMQEAVRSGLVESFFGPSTKATCTEFQELVMEYLTKEGRNSPLKRYSPIKRPSPLLGVAADELGEGDMLRQSDPKELKLTKTCHTVAKQLGGAWKEWWSFLDSFVDTTAEITLLRLEKCFADRRTGYHEAAFFQPPSPLTGNLELVEALSLFYHKSHKNQSDDGETEVSTNEYGDLFYTPPSSPIFGSRESGRQYRPRTIAFLGGTRPSSVDFYVYEALKDVPVPEDLYYVSAWKSAVMVAKFGADDLLIPMDQLKV